MRVFHRFARWETALVFLLIVELIIVNAISPGFLDPGRLLRSASDYVWIGVVAIPLALVMISGGIDISIGSMVSLSSITLGVLFASGVGIWWAVLAALAIGALAGLTNGALIVATGSHPLVITLGTLFLYSGLAVGMSGLGGVSAYEGISGFPDAFIELGNGSLLGIPNQVLVFLLVAVAVGFILHSTPLGRRLRLIGVNEDAARYAGIAVNRSKIIAYVLTGLGSGLAGVMLSSYFASARPDLGSSVLLPAITAVVVGGVSIYGGVGTVAGVALATVVLGILQQGLRFSGLSNDLVTLLIGVVLVLAAASRQVSLVVVERLRVRRSRSATIDIDAQHRELEPTP
jgi:AI-2 transport system permease protein